MATKSGRTKSDNDVLKEGYALFGKNLDAFSTFFLKHVLSYTSPEFHKEIDKALFDNDRVLIAAPRGFAKSTRVGKFYPLHASLFCRHRDIVIISASESLAMEHVRWIKNELENNEKIKLCFGNMKSEKWTETHIVIKHPDFTCNIRAKGAGGQIRGFRPDCIILDDIETDEGVESEDQRKKLKDWIFKACLNTLLPGGKFLWIGTIIHPLSVLSTVLSSDNGWYKKKYQAYIDGREEIGKELWPSLWPHDKLQQRKREIGSWSFASEYMNNPMSDENSPVRDTYIRYYDELPREYGLVVAVDPAYSQDESADFKVVVVVAYTPDGKRYLVDYNRSHCSSGEFQDSILNMWLRHRDKCVNVGCPSGAGDREFFNGLEKRASERKIYPPLIELKNTFKTATGSDVKNKKARITAALQPIFEKGMYYIRDHHIEALDEILSIGHSKHDDVVDAMTYAEMMINQDVYFTEQEEKNYVKMSGKSSNYGMDE